MKEVIVKSVEQLNEKKTCSLVKKAFKDGYDRKFIIDCLQDGMDRVGKLYESNTYYIADLIMAGMIFKKILEMDQMNPDKTAHDDEVRGIILVGTVEKDIHDIGKDLFAGICKAVGFKVVDLGVDVKKEVFVEKIIEEKPDIVGMSGILTLSVGYMRDTVDAIKNAGLRDRVKIIAGGNNILPEEGVEIIGADACVKSANEGLNLCREWMKEKGK